LCWEPVGDAGSAAGGGGSGSMAAEREVYFTVATSMV